MIRLDILSVLAVLDKFRSLINLSAFNEPLYVLLPGYNFYSYLKSIPVERWHERCILVSFIDWNIFKFVTDEKTCHSIVRGWHPCDVHTYIKFENKIFIYIPSTPENHLLVKKNPFLSQQDLPFLSEKPVKKFDPDLGQGDHGYLRKPVSFQ